MILYNFFTIVGFYTRTAEPKKSDIVERYVIERICWLGNLLENDAWIISSSDSHIIRN